MNLPNKITLTRIFMIPIFVALFYVDALPFHYVLAAAVFLLAALTDALDGYLARSRNLVTNLGKFLDPIADKVLVSTALIVLLTRPQAFLAVGAWGLPVAGMLVALILARELIVSGFRMIAAGQNVVLAADKLGKIKTVTQDVSIVFLLVCMDLGAGTAGQIIAYVGLAVFALSAILTVVSGVNYIVKNRCVLSDQEARCAEDDISVEGAEDDIAVEGAEDGEAVAADEASAEEDALLPQVVRYAVENGKISISAIQRYFAIGYCRAGRILDWMEEKGYVTPFAEGTTGREVLITEEEYKKLFEEE